MVDTSAFDQPEARGLRLIVATLRVTTAAQCFGAAAVTLWQAGESPVAQMMAVGRDLSAEQTLLLDRVAAVCLAASGMFSLTRPCWPVLLPVTAWFAADAAAPLSAGDEWWRWLGPLAAAASVLVPATLMLIDLYPPRAKFSLARFLIGGLFVRSGAAAAFLGVGGQCLYHARAGGGPASMMHRAGWVLTGQTLHEDVVAYGLLGTGAVLVGLAINLMAARARAVAAAMTVLGAALAVCEVFRHGPIGAAHMLQQLSLAGAPATVFLYWAVSIREQDGQLRPRGD